MGIPRELCGVLRELNGTLWDTVGIVTPRSLVKPGKFRENFLRD